MLWDRIGKIVAGRQTQRAGDDKGKVDRFEAVSEAEARLREVYAKDNEALRAELTGAKTTISELQRALKEAEDRITTLERQLKGV